MTIMSQIDMNDNHDHGCLMLETSNVPEIEKFSN